MLGLCGELTTVAHGGICHIDPAPLLRRPLHAPPLEGLGFLTNNGVTAYTSCAKGHPEGLPPSPPPERGRPALELAGHDWLPEPVLGHELGQARLRVQRQSSNACALYAVLHPDSPDPCTQACAGAGHQPADLFALLRLHGAPPPLPPSLPLYPILQGLGL